MFCSTKLYSIINNNAQTMMYRNPPYAKDFMEVAYKTPNDQKDPNAFTAARYNLESSPNGPDEPEKPYDPPIPEGPAPPPNPPKHKLNDRLMVIHDFAKLWVAQWVEIAYHHQELMSFHISNKDWQIMQQKGYESHIDPFSPNSQIDRTGCPQLHYIMNSSFRIIEAPLLTGSPLIENEWYLIVDPDNEYTDKIPEEYLHVFPVNPNEL